MNLFGQKIAIARAVLKEHRILLLDEATSALDNESEKIVQKSLDNLIADNKSHHRTTVIIAHRLSTVRNADCIYVLENSGDGAVVVESGSHEDLVAKNGKYKALLNATVNSSEDWVDSYWLSMYVNKLPHGGIYELCRVSKGGREWTDL